MHRVAERGLVGPWRDSPAEDEPGCRAGAAPRAASACVVHCRTSAHGKTRAHAKTQAHGGPTGVYRRALPRGDSSPNSGAGSDRAVGGPSWSLARHLSKPRLSYRARRVRAVWPTRIKRLFSVEIKALSTSCERPPRRRSRGHWSHCHHFIMKADRLWIGAQAGPRMGPRATMRIRHPPLYVRSWFAFLHEALGGVRAGRFGACLPAFPCKLFSSRGLDLVGCCSRNRWRYARHRGATRAPRGHRCSRACADVRAGVGGHLALR